MSQPSMYASMILINIQIDIIQSTYTYNKNNQKHTIHMQASPTNPINTQPNNIMQHIQIRIRKYALNTNNQYVLFIHTYDHNNEEIQCVHRTIAEVENLYHYILKQYGGHIIPMLHLGTLYERGIGVDQLMDQVEAYLEEIRNNHTCCQDAKYYCFLFEQAMVLPREQSYAKVLVNASNMSRKYLNAIFTRKQIPGHKDAQAVFGLFQKLMGKFQYFGSVRDMVMYAMEEERCLEDIKSTMSEISGVPCPIGEPHDDQMTEVQKIIRMSDKYVIQTKQAYSRWQILIEGVRELQANVFKGLKEDQARLQSRSHQLKTWTNSLSKQFQSMSIYFDNILDLLCEFVNNIKCRTIQCTMLVGQANSQLQYKQQKNQIQYLSSQQKQGMSVSNDKHLHTQLNFEKIQFHHNPVEQSIKITHSKLEDLDIVGTETTLEQSEIQNFKNRENGGNENEGIK